VNGLGQDAQAALDKRIRAEEERATEHLAALNVFEREWAEYRQAMRENSTRFEEAGRAIGDKEYFVQKGLAARQDMDSFVSRLIDEQVELLEQAARDLRADSEAELGRLQREKSDA